jgi:hypothetical protein
LIGTAISTCSGIPDGTESRTLEYFVNDSRIGFAAAKAVVGLPGFDGGAASLPAAVAESARTDDTSIAGRVAVSRFRMVFFGLGARMAVVFGRDRSFSERRGV